MKDQLFLLKPGFFNATLGPLYCGDSVAVEGMLSFFPQLRELVDVHYIDFPRPRAELVSLLGEDRQSVPVLIVRNSRPITDKGILPQQANGERFFDNERLIRRYLSAHYELPVAG